jgi:hypothetical protein
MVWPWSGHGQAVLLGYAVPSSEKLQIVGSTLRFTTQWMSCGCRTDNISSATAGSRVVSADFCENGRRDTIIGVFWMIGGHRGRLV